MGHPGAFALANELVRIAPDGLDHVFFTNSGSESAALAALGVYQSEGLLTRAKSLAKYWEDAAHALRGLPHVIDVRNYGLILGLELESIPGKAGTRAFEVFIKCFERGVLVRQTADIIALSPPLIIEQSQIDQIFGTLTAVLRGQ